MASSKSSSSAIPQRILTEQDYMTGIPGDGLMVHVASDSKSERDNPPAPVPQATNTEDPHDELHGDGTDPEAPFGDDQISTPAASDETPKNAVTRNGGKVPVLSIRTGTIQTQGTSVEMSRGFSSASSTAPNTAGETPTRSTDTDATDGASENRLAARDTYAVGWYVVVLAFLALFVLFILVSL